MIKGTSAMTVLDENIKPNLNVESTNEKLKKKKRINSKQKGARGERAWRDFLREEGCVKAHRSQQYSGANNDADVTVPEMPLIHHEVKVGQQVPKFPYDAIFQAQIGKRIDQIPIVACRRDFCDWLVVMRAADWVNLIKEAGHLRIVFCPDCKSPDVHKRSEYLKGGHRYECLNIACKRQTFIYSELK